MKTAAEMTARGRRGKPTTGFPPCPQALEITARFPHSRRLAIATERDPKSETRRPAARSYPPPFRLILRLENAQALVNI